MKISAKLEEADLKRMISDALKSDPNFPHGADVSFGVTKGDRPHDVDVFYATATPRNYVQPKD